jgi:iron complex outermembrane recepter protein
MRNDRNFGKTGTRSALQLFASSSVIGLMMVIAAPFTVLAQDNAAASGNAPAAAEESIGLEDIIVTATKVATNVQDTPIAITAVTSETLQTRGLTTTAELGNIVPNATFRKSEGVFGPAVSVYVRGIGQTDPQFSGEPAVAYYIDDNYYPFLFGSQFDLIDLDHVEVLRGPQGTLFGRNSVAGAINMVSKKPSLSEASAFIELDVGAYNRRDVRAGFSVPLTSNLAFSASAVSKRRDGYQELLDFSCQMYANGTPQLAGKFPFQTPETTWGAGAKPESCVIDHYGGENTRAFRGQFYWKPAEKVEVLFSGDYTNAEDENPAEYVFEYDYLRLYGRQANGTVNEALARPNFITAADQFSIPGTPFRLDERFETGDPYKTYDNSCDPFPAGTRITGNTYYNGSIYRGGKCYGRTTQVRNRGLQGKIIVGVTDQIDLTLIGGYRKFDMRFGAASDGTVLNDSLIFHENHGDHWTGEARATAQYDMFSAVAGLFYYKGDYVHLGQPQGVDAGTQRYQVDDYEPKAWAAYTNVVVRPLEGVSVTGGLRYSDDQKHVFFNSVGDGTPAGQSTFVGQQPTTTFDLVIATKRWDWKLGADYKVNDDLLVYASAGSGYRLPSFNVRPTQPGQEGIIPGDALISYELGLKGEFFDRRLRFNAAAFYMTFTERAAGYAGQEGQLNATLNGLRPGTQTVIPGGPAGTDRATAFTTCRAYNAATDGPQNLNTTPDKGVGVACVARTYSYGISDGKIKGFEAEVEAEPIENLNITGSVGFTSSTSAGVTRQTTFPKWTASGGISYKIVADMLGGSVTPRLDWYYAGAIAYNGNLPQYDQPGRSIFNGRITYKNEANGFDVSLGATNLFNKFYYLNKFLRIPLGSSQNLGQPSAPREWYLSFKKRF